MRTSARGDLGVRRLRVSITLLMGVVFLAQANAELPAEPIDFGRQVRPILANNCFKCHGPDEAVRQSKLELDSFAGATAAAKSGKAAIVPGKPDASELIARLTSSDAAVKMPPPETNKHVSAEEIETLRRWIAQGAEYKPHWAFVPPQKPAVPPVKSIAWPRNAIDNFIAARLEGEGLAPSAEADPDTLLRRASLDLIGTPPTTDDMRAFTGDKSAVAYENAVERMLASPHFGERWARMWLDAARYADTRGYEKDDRRIIWRFRDWVIDAFNRDLPFDQFTVDQVAGDMLPNATQDQILATAFNRNTMTNDEGGTDDEEFRVAAIVDRVNTTMSTWMGLSMGCAQCHTHKYDPITHTEYYQFFALLNQTEDADRSDEEPRISSPTPDQARKLLVLDTGLADARGQLQRAAEALTSQQPAWEVGVLNGSVGPSIGAWQLAGPFHAADYDAVFNKAFPPESAIDLDAKYEDGKIAWVAHPEWKDDTVYNLDSGEASAFYLYRSVRSTRKQQVEFSLGSNDGIRAWVNGKQIHANKTLRGVGTARDTAKAELQPGENQILVKIVNAGGQWGFYFNSNIETIPESIVTTLRKPADQRSADESGAVRALFAKYTPELAPLNQRVEQLEKERAEINTQVPLTPVLRELPGDKQRVTHRFTRGSFLTPAEEVKPGTPAALNPFPADTPKNRLGLAKWIVDRQNPLTARVAVNRFWEQFFGIGIVQTVEDFGTQGEFPTHPELLDWLAVQFMDSGWSVKNLCRMIVTSSTYRQSSAVTPALRDRDPDNRLLARGPRVRLDAEGVRDQALRVAGLLSDKMYGPSVMPPQPEGVWNVVYSADKWVTASGDDKYRRGLYTFWRRTSPYPSMVSFDASSREVCTLRRVRTNTPLQALVTLNDPVYIEAAQALARRMIAEGGDTPVKRAIYGFKLATCREPRPPELMQLTRLYASEVEHYRNVPAEAQKMASDPIGPTPPGVDAAEAAAWTVVGNVLLNLDEVINKT